MVLAIATAGLVYELVMAAVASYVLGDSVRQFSLVIGVYLSALGLGAYLSRFVDRHLSITFIDVELAAALVGGLSAPALFLAFGFTSAFRLVLYSTVVGVGVLVGVELPLLIRILERQLAFKELIAKALTFDYAGALLGSLAFSLWLVPRLGLVHTSVACGLVNASVAVASTWLLPLERTEVGRVGAARVRAVIVVVLLLLAAIQADRALALSEQASYPGRVVHAEQSEYQRIVITEDDGEFQLYLNGNLQFSSFDEHRYHEALVHPAMAAADRRRSVLVGGGGDGLAVREILKWPEVERVVVVDLDAAVTRLARTYPPLVHLNRRALHDPRVAVENHDAMAWLGEHEASFDVAILDFPDPTNYSLGKLYSVEFFRLVERRLAPGAAMAVQSSSPFLARRAYWCVIETLKKTGLSVRPYRVYLPSFADWGYALARRSPFAVPSMLPPETLRYLTTETLPDLFVLPPDTGPVDVGDNRLNNQRLVGYYLDDWQRR